LSGGEPLDQPDFAECILKACKDLALHTAVETAGHVSWSCFERIISFTDLFLFDIKHTDPGKLKEFTKGDAARILQNLQKLVMRAKQLIVRTPVIPGFNDSAEEIQKIARLVKSLGIKELHMLPYHQYGQSKYRLMGRKYIFRGSQQVEAQRMLALRDTASREGIKVQVGG
jgi:pyruvate formate lyase activating enzyme